MSDTVTDMTIDEAPSDLEVSGAELLPISDGGVAKKLTTGDIKDWVLAKIAEITAAESVSVGSDGVYILKSGEIKPVDSECLAKAVLNYGFGKVAVVEMDGNEIIGVKDSTQQKTITTGQFKSWLEGNMTVTATVDLANMTSAGTLGDSDLALVAQAAGNRKVSISTLKDYALGKLAAFVSSLTAAQSVGADDVIYLVQGGQARKATVSQLVGGTGDVIAPLSHVAGNIPTWDDTAKKLTTGLGVVTAISTSAPSVGCVPTASAVFNALASKGDVAKAESAVQGSVLVYDSAGKVENGPTISTTVGSSPSDDCIPTEKAVSEAIEAHGGVTPSGTHTSGSIPAWGSGNELEGGYGVSTSIPSAASASDGAVPTEKAVRTLVDGFVQMPASHSEDAIPAWGAGSELKAGKTVATTLRSADNASDDCIPTEKAVAARLVNATSASGGLMSAADKSKLDGMVDTGSVQEIGEALDDSDMVVVKDNDTTWRKSLVSRLWTYLMGKLASFKLDDLGAPDDNQDLNFSTTRHGLCPKGDGAVTHFLRGDGAWAEPPGSSDFTGDSGDGGVHGLVPAPDAGDAAGNKFLCASGVWATTPAAAGVDIPGKEDVPDLDVQDLFYVYDSSEGDYCRVSAADIAAMVNGAGRYDTLFVPAGAFTPSKSDGATMSALQFSNNTHDTAAFIGGSDTSAEFNCALPDDWDGGTVKAKMLWTCSTATAEAGQTVAFALSVRSFSDGDNVTDAPGVEVLVSDALIAVNYQHVSAASGSITPAGSPAGGQMLHFKVRRSVDDGTMTATAHVLGVLIQYRREGAAEEW